MRKLSIALALLAFCTTAHAALLDNPESFEDDFVLPPEWQYYCSGSGIGGWTESNCGADINISDGTDGTHCLQTWVGDADWWGYTLAWNPDNPVTSGDIYTFSVDYKLLVGNAVIKLEFWEDPGHTNQVSVLAWDPLGGPVGAWEHFSHTFRVPDGAQYLTIVLGATGANCTVRYDMVSLAQTLCPYELEGDEDGDCRVTLNDLALMFANWLIDCIDDPTDPACVTP